MNQHNTPAKMRSILEDRKLQNAPMKYRYRDAIPTQRELVCPGAPIKCKSTLVSEVPTIDTTQANIFDAFEHMLNEAVDENNYFF